VAVSRSTHGEYADPLDLIWLSCAARLGLRVVRSDETYASWDGHGTLTLCTAAAFDPDDSVAQLVLHELCHAIVQGPERLGKPDWGLENDEAQASATEEHACHRLQAALLDRYGLRRVLAVTTDWRPYWDALPADPLAAGDDPAIEPAREAWARATRGPWSAALDAALRATAVIARAAAPWAPEGSLFRGVPDAHPLGVATGPGTCGACAWRTEDHRCLAEAPEGHQGPPVQPDWPGCYRYEPRLDDAACRSCGACCRQGFHLVAVDEDDPFLTHHPELVRRDGWGAHVPRPGGFCAALTAHTAPWTCGVYTERPRSCRDFEIGEEACLIARRRVGITRR
jgi:hypothetical protein